MRELLELSPMCCSVRFAAVLMVRALVVDGAENPQAAVPWLTEHRAWKYPGTGISTLRSSASNCKDARFVK